MRIGSALLNLADVLSEGASAAFQRAVEIRERPKDPGPRPGLNPANVIGNEVIHGQNGPAGPGRDGDSEPIPYRHSMTMWIPRDDGLIHVNLNIPHRVLRQDAKGYLREVIQAADRLVCSADEDPDD